ncbi:MAG: hypothetical protein JW990_10015 [Thermoleophilia bacterium]|nr:hypothetical protein [Thermoleophilia bacterium]
MSRLISTVDLETSEPDIYLEDRQNLEEYGLNATVLYLTAGVSSSPR